MKKFIVLLLFLFFPLNAYSKEITNVSKIKLNNEEISTKVIDNNEKTYISIKKNQSITIESQNNIKGLYLVYEVKGGKGILSSGLLTTKFGDNAFLHDYIDIEGLIGLSKSITLKYAEDTSLTDIYVIGEGDIPSFVEIWNAPVEKADLLLFTTHSDDEQLFFSGLLPNYVAKGANVQVVYFTHHSNNIIRYHEQLHGLYKVGIRNYPIIGPIPDAWASTLNAALNNLKKAGLSEKDAMTFEVEMIRRFKPLVVVGHDEKGEYGHGQHILCTYLLERAIDKANDSSYDLDSYNKYGLWSTKKVYIHLYPKNQIIMDYDQPLEYFNGKTAFQVSQEGFKCHISQQYTWFKRWMNGENNEITKASEITTYSPREYGLFRSLVGPDKKKNNMFENLLFYKDIVDEEAYFNQEVEETINESPMEYNDAPTITQQLFLITVIVFSGIGILYLIRKI